MPHCFTSSRESPARIRDRAVLQESESSEDASGLWRLLDQSRQTADLGGWDGILAEIRWLVARRPDTQRLGQLTKPLRLAAPDWTAQIEDGTAVAFGGIGDDCPNRWQCRCAQSGFDPVIGSVASVAHGSWIEQTREWIRGPIQELMGTSYWLEVSKVPGDPCLAPAPEASTPSSRGHAGSSAAPSGTYLMARGPHES